MKKTTLFLCAIFLTMIGYSHDCINTSSFEFANMSTSATKSISSYNYFNEYSTINSINIGYEGVLYGAQTSNSDLPDKMIPLRFAPINDNCENAIALSCDGSFSGSTVTATQSGLANLMCAGGTPADVFYSLDVVAGNEYTITVVGDNYDAVLAIYTGLCDNLIELACADNNFSAGEEETITFTASITETVVIRTYDWSSSAGDFTISAVCESLSIDENNMFAETHLFPNPLNGNILYINTPNLNGESVEVNIKDMAGRQIYNNTLECYDNKLTVSLNDILTSGVYLVTLKEAGQAHTYKLIKQ